MIIKLLLAHKNKIALISIIYTALLMYLSLDTLKTSMKLPSQSDKLFHALAYFIFTFFWWVTIYSFLKVSFKKTIIIASFWSLLFGILIEFLQHFLTANRQGDILDILANALGTLFAVLIINIFILKTVKS